MAAAAPPLKEEEEEVVVVKALQPHFSLVLLLVACCFLCSSSATVVTAASWCVARSDASFQALQAALDYACFAGADCAPIQSTGLCYLPNTIQAHASYAFNSYFQRKGMAAGSCDFSGTATIAKTDPSYGSCVYPSNPSTAGGIAAPGGTSTPAGGSTTPITTPNLIAPPPPGTAAPVFGTAGSLTPGLGPVVPNSQNSKAPTEFGVTGLLYLVPFFLSLSFI